MNKIIAPIEEVILELITAGQIGRASDRFSEQCRVNAISLPKKIVQVVLEDEGDALAQEMFEAFRRRVERWSEMIVRRVRVNRALTPQAVLDSTGRKQYIDASIVETMPRGEGEEVEVFFFPGKRTIPASELALEYESRGLVPDPYAQAQANIDDFVFADECPNGTQWKDSEGNLCYLTFGHWNDERRVSIHRHVSGWHGSWWFGGVHKVSPQTQSTLL